MKRSNFGAPGSARSVGRESWLRPGLAIACGLALAMFSLAAPAAAQKKSKSGGSGGVPAGNTAVTSTLDGNIDNPAYQIQSDGNGPYTNNTDKVDSYIETTSSCGGGCGDWKLGMNGSNIRSISVTLVPDPNLSQSLPAPFSGPVLVDAGIIVNCSLTVTNSFLAITPPTSTSPGAQIDCPMAMNFHYNGIDYKMSMGYPLDPPNTAVQVTCKAGDSAGVCDSWTVLSSGTLPDGTTGNVARLQVYQAKGKTQGWFLVGYFDVNFSFKVTNP